MRRLAFVLAMLCLAFFAYATFPGGIWALWAFAVGALLLRPGLPLDRWPLWKAWLFSLGGVGLGMLIRYFAEYGEAWWRRSFTAENILLYLALTPVYILLAFRGIGWLDRRRKSGRH